MKRTICFLPALALFAASTSVQAAPVVLPIDGLDTADVNFSSVSSDLGGGILGISDAQSLGAGGGSDHFDEAFGVTVDGSGYSVTGGDLTGNTLTLDSIAIGQYDVQVEFTSSGPVMRQIVNVTNTGAAGTASVRWHNNTGNDGSQQTIASSDGDTVGEASDRWIVTADSTTGTDNEVNSWILFGTGTSLAPTSLAMVDGNAGFGFAGEQGLNAIFDLALGAGETGSLMWFVGIEGINADGISLAMMFDDTSSGFFQGLTADLSEAEKARIANWDLGDVESVPVPAPLALLGLGFLALTARKHLK